MLYKLKVLGVILLVILGLLVLAGIGFLVSLVWTIIVYALMFALTGWTTVTVIRAIISYQRSK